nr:carboxymuconolactone decarboxylase family protein [Pseudopedobacter sp.]
MSTLKIHDQNSAPEKSKPFLENSIKSFGSIPNLHGVLAGAPGLIEAYQKLHQLFIETSFTNEEKTVVWQTINVEHACHYCVPAHTAIANMMQVAPEITEALRNETKMPTDKLQALHETTLILVRNRGRISDKEVEAFFNAGYNQQQLLEIILGISQKVISNYTNHIAETPIDPSFEKFAWKKK